MIENIEIGRLYRHPKNPRKTPGDLTELAASIKANGVLQNLTVVPYYGTGTPGGGDYCVVIGHRRLEAAKIAGLEEVPCTIVEIDEKAQIATMLIENMQRSDLTVIEQADGIQTLIDLGETYKSISEKTGLSKSTVSKRAKLVKTFSRESLEAVQGRPIQFDDYEKLYSITDESKRNECLEKIGTSNFDWAVQNALSYQEKKIRIAKIVAVLSEFASEASMNAYRKASTPFSSTFWGRDEDEIETAENLAKTHDVEKKYFYAVNDYNITLYTISDGKDNKADEYKREDEERKVRIGKINEAFKRAATLRVEFMKGFRTSQSTIGAANDMVVEALFNGVSFDKGAFRGVCGIEKRLREYWEKETEDSESLNDAKTRIIGEKTITQLLMIGAYCRLDNIDAKCIDYSGKYRESATLTKIYKLLAELGYEMSEDEIKLLDGTHGVYGTEGNEND